MNEQGSPMERLVRFGTPTGVEANRRTMEEMKQSEIAAERRKARLQERWGENLAEALRTVVYLETTFKVFEAAAKSNPTSELTCFLEDRLSSAAGFAQRSIVRGNSPSQGASTDGAWERATRDAVKFSSVEPLDFLLNIDTEVESARRSLAYEESILGGWKQEKARGEIEQSVERMRELLEQYQKIHRDIEALGGVDVIRDLISQSGIELAEDDQGGSVKV